MAATLVNTVLPYVPGVYKEAVLTLTGDASYPTGGYALTPASFGFATKIVDCCSVDLAQIAVATCSSAVWDAANQKVKLFLGAAEVANTTNVSTAVIKLTAIGY